MLNSKPIELPLGVHFNLYLHDYPKSIAVILNICLDIYSLGVRLLYSKWVTSSQAVQGYIDFDYIWYENKIRSLSRYIFTMFDNPVSCRWNLQSIVALSTM